MNIKINGIIKVETIDGDFREYPFESKSFNGACEEIGKIERMIGIKIAEQNNRFEDIGEYDEIHDKKEPIEIDTAREEGILGNY